MNLPAQQARPEAEHIILLQKSEGQLQAALGPGGDAKRFVRLAITEFRANPKLMLCHPQSFMLAVHEGARLGLEVGKQLGQFYLIPRKGEVVPMLGYRGMIALGLRHPDVQTITSTAVYKGDFFEYGENMEGQYFHYRPCGNKKADELERIFAVCRLKNGGVILEVMERAEIELARSKSLMGNGGPWVEFYGEMARKTAVRRLFKYIPLVPEVGQAIAEDEKRWENYEEARRPEKYKDALKEVERQRLEGEVLMTHDIVDAIPNNQGEELQRGGQK